MFNTEFNVLWRKLIKSARRASWWFPCMSNMKVMLFQKVTLIIPLLILSMKCVYFVFLLLSKNTNLQWAWKPLPTLIKEQQTVLALNCAKRESTAEASGSANTPSVITTAPDQKQNKADRNLCKMVFYSNRAANLWRTKIWRPSLFHYNPPPPPTEI